jgi:hypothetical protein
VVKLRTPRITGNSSMQSHRPLVREEVSFDPLQGHTLRLNVLTFAPLDPLLFVTPTLLREIPYLPLDSNIDLARIYDEHEQANNPDRFLSPEITNMLNRSNATLFNNRDLFVPTPRQDPDQWRHYHPNTAQWQEWWAAHKMKEGFLLMPAAKVSNEEKLRDTSSYDSISEDYLCAISKEVMDDPVYDKNFEDNHRCERVVLEAWVNQYGTNPFTRTHLQVEDLLCDEVLKSEINNFVDAIVNPAPTI